MASQHLPSAANMDKLLPSPPGSDLGFKIATLNLRVRLPEKVFTNGVWRSPGKHKSRLRAAERRGGRRSSALQTPRVSISIHAARPAHAGFLVSIFSI